jgi:hypothetical protein
MIAQKVFKEISYMGKDEIKRQQQKAIKRNQELVDEKDKCPIAMNKMKSWIH